MWKHRAARRQLLLPCRSSGCLGTSRGSSSTTLPTPRVWVPRLVTQLVVWLIVNFFAYAVRPGASARHVARRRLFRLCRASGCLGSSRSLSRRSSSTTSPTPSVRVPRHVARLVTRLVVPLVVDCFAYAERSNASACRVARHTARLAAHRRLLRLHQASGCLGTSRGSSRGSSRRSLSTTLPTPHVRVPRHVARLVTRLVTRLVVDYSMWRDFVLRPQWLYFIHVVRRDYLSRGNTVSTSSTPRATVTSSSGRIASTIHLH
jgi:hypothetical protein